MKNHLGDLMPVSSLAKLYFELDSFHRSREARPLHVFSVFPKIETEEISEVARMAGVDATIENIGQRVYRLEVISARRRQRAHGYLVDHERLWNLLIRTVESPTVAGNVAELWLKRMYPAVCRSYIKSSDLLTIMDDLSKIEGAKLEMRSCILRAHDSPETVKRWPRDKPYSRKEIEQIIIREKKLLEAINFIFHVEETYFHVRIQTNGHFVFYEGGRYCFSNFQRLVLSKFNEVALINHKFFSNRERRIVDGKAMISRIVLNPKRELGKVDFESLSSHLSMKYSTAVLHSGNPWLLLNIIDRGDGSSFDLHGYPSEIQVVPFNRASPESLMRLVYAIYELFPLTEIKEEA